MLHSYNHPTAPVSGGAKRGPTIEKVASFTGSSIVSARQLKSFWTRVAVLVACCLLAPGSAMGQSGLLTGTAGAQKKSSSATVDTSPSPEKVTSLMQDLNLKQFWSENTLTHWLTLLVAIFLGLLAGRIASIVLRRIGGRLEQSGRDVRGQVVSGLAGPASLCLLTVGLMLGLLDLKMSSTLHTFWSRTLSLMYSIAFFWYAFNLVAVVDVMLHRKAVRTQSDFDRQMGPLIRKTLRIFLVVVGVMFVVDSVFKQDIGAWLAGFGIAGLAVSLAAQDSLKNLFGSITILFDRPFRIGERIVYAGHDGNIEEIGFRSVKVRTLDGHLVTIPNSSIVSDTVQNIGRRPFIKRTMNVTLTYDTPGDRIEQAVQIIRDILEEEGICEPIHSEIDGNKFPPRVYFSDYNADSLNILVIYWFAPPAYWDYLAHAQTVNLRIFKEFEKAGIEFAFPTQTLYLAGDRKRQLAVEMLGKDLQQPC